MPFIYDFNSAADEIHTVDVRPKGWRGPITIEYVVCYAHPYDPMASVAWRVKGTTHTFTIGEQRLNTLSNGKSYKEHFETALENFRLDYMSWFTEKEYEGAEWRDEYRQQYGRYILPGEPNNKGKSEQSNT